MSASPATSRQITVVKNSLAAAAARFGSETDADRESYQRIIKRRGEFEDGIVALLKRLSAKLPDYTTARSILGGDLITPEEIMVARPGVVYSPEQIAQLTDSIPSEEVLRSLKENGYGLMPQTPDFQSLLEVRALEPALFYSKTGGWYEKQIFAQNKVSGSGNWLAIKKTPVADSTNKNWNEQLKLITSVEHIPSAAEMSWFITTFFKTRGVRLFENIYARCSDLDSDGDRVDVGNFGAKGLYVFYDWDDDRHDVRLGLSVSRKI